MNKWLRRILSLSASGYFIFFSIPYWKLYFAINYLKYHPISGPISQSLVLLGNMAFLSAITHNLLAIIIPLYFWRKENGRKNST